LLRRSRTSQHFMKLEGSLQYLQKLLPPPLVTTPSQTNTVYTTATYLIYIYVTLLTFVFLTVSLLLVFTPKFSMHSSTSSGNLFRIDVMDNSLAENSPLKDQIVSYLLPPWS
jgi:hypothetical protein